MSKLKAKEAEIFKERFLPIYEQEIVSSLDMALENTPAYMLILFEDGKGANTHYRHNANPEDIINVANTLRAIAGAIEEGLAQKAHLKANTSVN